MEGKLKWLEQVSEGTAREIKMAVQREIAMLAQGIAVIGNGGGPCMYCPTALNSYF